MTEFRFDISDLATLVRDRLPFHWTWISGVEVTQSIQHYQSALHLNDPADHRADNAARLVANKPAWVRVYAQSLAERSVTASLTIERRSFGFLWFPVATLTPRGTGVLSASVTESYAQERSSTAETLNFVIPAADFHGTLRLTVRLRHATSGTEYDSHTLVVNAALRQTLRLRAILVSYNGPRTSVASTPPPPTITLAAPTLADAQATAARALLDDARAVHGVVHERRHRALEPSPRRPADERGRLLQQLERAAHAADDAAHTTTATAATSSTTACCPG